MDIFTTQLAQSSPAVNAPINPAKLKVKGVLKYARKGKLKADKRELDQDDYGFYHSKDNGESNSQQQKGYFAEQEVVQLSDEALNLEKQNLANTETVQTVTKTVTVIKSKNSQNQFQDKLKSQSQHNSKKTNHLDIFI